MYALELSESLVPAQTDGRVREISVGGLLREVAGQHPEAPALVEVDLQGQTGRTWTYAQLLADSESLALALATRCSPGERITAWAPNIPEWLLLEYACALAGLVLVTANPSYQPQELRYVLEQSGSVALFYVQSYRGNPMAEIAQKACAGLASVRELVDLQERPALYRQGRRHAVLPQVAPGAAAQIQYTSGTTGFPKGAVLSHRGLVNNARFAAARAQAHQGSVWANFMPMFHTSGCSLSALGSLQAGCKMLLFSLFDAAALARLIAHEKITTFFAVPTMLVALLESLQQHPRDVSSMEVVVTGGAPVAPQLVSSVRAALGSALETAFGQTEASSIIAQNYPDGSIEDLCTTAGQPLPQAAVSIRSLEDNAVVPLGTVGEICVQGYCTMIGYHANQTATAQALDGEGWLHTGDLGSLDARGFIRVTGRVKEMIIRGGENHFPVEIENVFLQHPAVAEVAVVGLPDEKWGERIACFIRPEEGQVLDVQELRRYCRIHLSPQKTPAVWCQVARFPLTGSGKIQKFALREGYLAGEYAPLPAPPSAG